MSKQFKIHIPISKIDEEQRMVYGVATTEAVDSQNDIVDYEASKAAFSSWLGNIREMHQPIAVGKAIDIQFDDESRQVVVGAKISESRDGENAWVKVKEGVLNGFSIGGNINKVTKETAKVDGAEVPVTRIVDYDLAETSLVDNPANPEALFVMVKSRKGGLQRVEETIIQQKDIKKEFKLPAWHVQFMLPIEKAQALYDKSMKKGKKTEMKKSMWDAAMLMDLCLDLNYYIQCKQMDGEDVSEMVAALDTIKQAIINELSEPTEEVTMAVELAQKVINLEKGKAMSKDDIKKAADEAEEVVDETTEEVATETEAAEVEEPKADEAEAAKAEESEEEAGEESSEESEETEESESSEESEAEEESNEAESEDNSEKAATLGDLKKFTDSLLNKLGDNNKQELTKVFGEFTDKVEKSISTLADRVKKLEDQPATPKAKASYVDVEKSSDGDESEEELKDLLKRQEELIANPQAGTPQERIELAQKLRKFQAAGAKLA